MSTFKRILALLFLILMCFSSLIACGDEAEITPSGTTPTSTTPPTSSSSSSTTQTDPGTPSTPTISESLLNETKFSGKTCHIWQANPAYYGPGTSFYVNSREDAKNAVERAAWARQNAIKNKNGITLSVTKSVENSAVTGSKDIQTLEAWLKTEDPSKIPDIVIPGAHTSCVLMAKNYFCGLKSLYTNDFGTEKNYLDFAKDCWDDNINNALALASEYYLVSGAYCVSNAGRTTAMFIDKQALSQINTALLADSCASDYQDINTIYQWVTDGTWTWNKLLALAKAYTGENGSVAAGKYGLEYSQAGSYPIYISTGKQYVATDPNTLLPASQVGDTETIQVMRWLIDNIRKNPTTNIWGGGDGHGDPEKFAKNHSVLFSAQGIDRLKYYSELELSGEETFDFTVVPMPKFDYATSISSTTRQEQYSGCVAAWFFYTAAIPKHCESPSFSSFVLQLMSEMGKLTYSDGVSTVYEAYIEDGLTGRYAPVDLLEDHPEILYLIFDSAKVDFGEAYIWSSIPVSIGDQVRNAFNAGEEDRLSTIHTNVADKIKQQATDLFWKLGIYAD